MASVLVHCRGALWQRCQLGRVQSQRIHYPPLYSELVTRRRLVKGVTSWGRVVQEMKLLCFSTPDQVFLRHWTETNREPAGEGARIPSLVRAPCTALAASAIPEAGYVLSEQCMGWWQRSPEGQPVRAFAMPPSANLLCSCYSLKLTRIRSSALQRFRCSSTFTR